MELGGGGAGNQAVQTHWNVGSDAMTSLHLLKNKIDLGGGAVRGH